MPGCTCPTTSSTWSSARQETVIVLRLIVPGAISQATKAFAAFPDSAVTFRYSRDSRPTRANSHVALD
jgi:hypothetical protein